MQIVFLRTFSFDRKVNINIFIGEVVRAKLSPSFKIGKGKLINPDPSFSVLKRVSYNNIILLNLKGHADSAPTMLY